MKQHYYFFIRLVPMMLFVSCTTVLFAQGTVVTGIVKEEASGAPVPGVNILVKGTTSGTVTDIDGNYRINVPDDAILVFSAVGFISEEIPVQNRSVINLNMAQDIQSLSEVVVVGYGTQERARVTSAISSISSSEINELPIASIDQALQGRAAGVNVTSAGSPGQNPFVRIRGLGSLGNNEPLYVIDGMPAGGLNNINPNDIESMEILKDAAAASIYGSRASNGVILVTTKKGTKGKTTINFDTYTGIQEAWRTLDLLKRDQYLDYGRTLVANDPSNFDDDPANDVDVPSRFNDLGEFANVETDWQDEMFRVAPIRDYNVSISGGGEHSTFNLAGGYFDQEGIMLGTGFKRYSVRANSEFTLGRVKVGETLTVSYSQRNNEPFNGSRSQIEHMIKSIPYIPVRDPNFLGGFRAPDREDASDPENPVLNANLLKSLDENMKLIGTAYASVEILKGLEYKFLIGMDMNFGYQDRFNPMVAPSNAYHIVDRATVNHNRTEFISPLYSNQLSYNKTLDKHTIGAIAVIERQDFRTRNDQGTGTTQLTNNLEVLNGLQEATVAGQAFERSIISYLGRVTYDFDGKYLLAASIRRDGSSRFGPEYKWGIFPSVSAGWRISQEEFMMNVPVISDLKIRGSWGKTGLDNLNDYQYQATIDGNFLYNLNGVAVPASTTRMIANKELKWESTVMTNIGLDLGLLNDKLRFSAEYFNNKTSDLLLPVPIQLSLGVDVNPYANVGAVVNKGWEITGGFFQNTGDFQWSLNGNISFVRNEVTSLGAATAVNGARFENDETTNTEVGEPMGYFYGWVVDGIFQSDAEVEAANALGDTTVFQSASTSPGDIRFKDLNGDGVIGDDDRTKLGHYLPDFSYGLTATARYKNLDLTMFFQGVSGNEILNTNLYDLEGMTRLFNAGTNVINAWTPENPNTDVPRAVNTDPNRNARISSRYVEDGSYLRLKNLALGYSLPSTVLNNVAGGFIKSLRVYISSQNLLTFTSYSGYDPEIGTRPDLVTNTGGGNISQSNTLNSGVDYGQYPQARTFIGGVQIGF